MRDTRARWDIGDVLARTDLAALLDELTTPAAHRMGPGRRWHCPVAGHEDHRASVTMHRDHRGHQRWRCWSADHRGDAIDLVSAVTGRDRADAIDWLATRAGMTPDRPLPPIRPRQPGPAQATAMDPAVERYVEVGERILRSRHGTVVRDWLHQRGFTDPTIAANRLGCDPGRQMLARRRGLPYGAGMAAVFPAFDPAGNVTYVQARYLDSDTVGRKYDNPSAQLAPHPRRTHPVNTPPTHAALLVVCEGIPDALTAAQAGYRAVGLLGAQTPDDSVAARIANHATASGLDVVVMCDPDPAGRHVADVLVPLLGRHGAPATVLTPPAGVGDLNEWALTDPHWSARLADALQRDTPASSAGIDIG
jgi:DNA primase